MRVQERKKSASLFARDRQGAAAIEFAIVAPLFLALMFSTFEVGWFYFVNSVTDAATISASRLIRTGQVQKWSGTPDEVYQKFYDEICDVVSVFGSCDTRLTVEAQTYSSFEDLVADLSDPVCADDTPTKIDAIPFDPGKEQEIVRVRVCMIYNTVNPAIGLRLAEPGTSVRRIYSSMVFRNEPYEKNKKKK